MLQKLLLRLLLLLSLLLSLLLFLSRFGLFGDLEDFRGLLLTGERELLLLNMFLTVAPTGG